MFEADVQQSAEGFRFRQHNFPVNQMFGWHSGVPTFLMNIHRVDTLADAEAYVARLNGVQKQAEQVLIGLQTRADKGIVPPKFVFPLVLDACRKLLQGRPFDESGSGERVTGGFHEKGRRR